MTRKLPQQKRGRSRQDYRTPREFLDAVEGRFGMIAFDLAAFDQTSSVRGRLGHFFAPRDDSLNQDWHKIRGNLWLNPPYADIKPWAEKCAFEASLGATIFLLTPASVGSCWFSEHVHGKAYVLALQPRLTFVGETHCYPKDLMLSVYGKRLAGFDVWKWQTADVYQTLEART